MRIAINTRLLLGDQLEGIGRYTQQIAQRLVQMRPNDEFLFCFDRPYSKKFIFSDNVEAIVIHPPSRHPILWYAWFEWTLPAALKKWKADVFISMDGYCSLKSKVPTLMVVHDLAYVHFPEQVPAMVRAFYRRYVPKYVHRADSLVTISEFSRSDLKQQFDLRNKRIEIVGNGARHQWPSLSIEEKVKVREKWSEGQPYFCALGAIHPRKNINGIIKGFSAFKQRVNVNHKLLIIGRMAWHTESVKQALDSSPFQEDIHLLGYQPDEAVRQILGGAEALLFLSLFEGFGVPMIEAMQLEVPIVYSNLSVMPEVAGEAGLAVDPLDAAAVAEAMENILDPNLQKGFAQGAKTQLAKYNWDDAAAKLNQLIDDLMN